MRSFITSIVLIFLLNIFIPLGKLEASEKKDQQQTDEDIYEARMQLYKAMQKKTDIDWRWIAAIDQYERTMTRAKPKYRKTEGTITQIYIDKHKWAGVFNPNQNETDPKLIQFFGGIGKDGNNDGQAQLNSDEDLLYSLLKRVSHRGIDDDNIKIGVWDYYQNARAVNRIVQFQRIYAEFNTLNLKAHAFPLPKKSIYSYRSTWGDRRGWGGKRIHEGTDIFAPYGTEVRSTCYGIIEVLGWNKYGGWRVGIRDLDNHYHYFAHLQGFNKELKINQVVKPSDVIGWVGSSGYGKPGTSGKFPPHLHYGIYTDRGYVEWAFDPYPSLKKWERQGR